METLRHHRLGALSLTAVLVTVTLLVAGVLTGDSQPAHAAFIVVSTTADELNTDGDCSLREAIHAANTDAIVDACSPGNGDDTIDLPAGIYTLSIAGAGEDANATGDLDITSVVTISGAGQATTIIDANGIDRVLDIRPGASLEISGVTIQGGNSPPSSNGGGISNLGGSLTLIDSTVSGNTALVHGGGIADGFGTLTLINSTVSGNSASGQGGGILKVAGTLTVERSTVSGYMAGGVS